MHIVVLVKRVLRGNCIRLPAGASPCVIITRYGHASAGWETGLLTRFVSRRGCAPAGNGALSLFWEKHGGNIQEHRGEEFFIRKEDSGNPFGQGRIKGDNVPATEGEEIL